MIWVNREKVLSSFGQFSLASRDHPAGWYRPPLGLSKSMSLSQLWCCLRIRHQIKLPSWTDSSMFLCSRRQNFCGLCPQGGCGSRQVVQKYSATISGTFWPERSFGHEKCLHLEKKLRGCTYPGIHLFGTQNETIKLYAMDAENKRGKCYRMPKDDTLQKQRSHPKLCLQAWMMSVSSTKLTVRSLAL